MTSRIIGSSKTTARGVKTRLTRARNRSCSDGSIMMMRPNCRTKSSPLESVDRSIPWALE